MENPETGRCNFYTVFIGVCIAVIFVCFSCVAAVLISESLEPVAAEHSAAQGEYAERNQSVSTFPHRMIISEKTAYLDAVHILEMYGNHSYVGYVIVSIDRGSLTDDDIYWVTKGYRFEWELNASAHWWPDGTDGDIASIDYFALLHTDTHIYFIFRTDPQRYSLKGKHFYVAVTYLPDGASIDEQYRYSYSVDFSGQHYHDSTDFLPDDALIALADAMIDAAT